jgi:hypothetical protein
MLQSNADCISAPSYKIPGVLKISYGIMKANLYHKSAHFFYLAEMILAFILVSMLSRYVLAQAPLKKILLHTTRWQHR